MDTTNDHKHTAYTQYPVNTSKLYEIFMRIVM